MAKIPKEVQEFLKGKMAWVATAASDGMPNTTPKGSVKIIDDEHIVFADLFSKKTRENLQANPKVAVTVADMTTYKGYQIKGSAKLLESGPLFEKMAEELAKEIALAPVRCPNHGRNRLRPVRGTGSRKADRVSECPLNPQAACSLPA
jgi:hypothetical protein